MAGMNGNINIVNLSQTKHLIELQKKSNSSFEQDLKKL